MKKKQLWLATILALSAGAAAAESSVTLYGLIDAGVSYTNFSYTDPTGNNAASNTQFGVRNGGQSPDRWGFKGAEDIGGGTQAIFNLEAGFNVSAGTAADGSRIFNRASWFGLQNPAWGAIKFGRQNSISVDYQGLVTDPFMIPLVQAGSNTTITWNGSRYDNLLSYETPVMNGVQAKFAYSFAGGETSYYYAGNSAAGLPTYSAGSAGAAYNFATQNNLTAVNVGVKYSNGPLYLVATWDQINPNTNLISGAVGSLSSVTGLIVGGYYDFESVKVYANYSREQNGLIGGGNQQLVGISQTQISDASAATTGAVIFAPGVSVNNYMLGLSAPVGASGKFLAEWQMSQPNGNLGNANLGVSAANEYVYSLGYTYNFSKRTNIYVNGSYANNYAMVSGLNSTQVTLGLRHLF